MTPAPVSDGARRFGRTLRRRAVQSGVRSRLTTIRLTRRIGRLRSALPGSTTTLLLLAAAFGCNVISAFSHDDQPDATVKETPMKAAKKARLHKIIKITTLGMLTTIADVAAAMVAAMSI